MKSLFSGVSGLKTHQTRMDVIGNNISNINTIGFKSSRATFADLISQTTSGASSPGANTGGVNPKQIGLGAQVSSVDMIFTDGSPQATGKNTDVTLEGNGLFVLKSGNDYYYSRDGAFEFDTNGNYVLPGSGLYVQGWNAISGNLDTNGVTENIVVKSGQTMEGTATTNVDYTGNINSASPVITAISYTAGGGTADPQRVLENRTVAEIRVQDAPNFTYDARVMSPVNGNSSILRWRRTGVATDEPYTETTLVNGQVYATSGNNATISDENGNKIGEISSISYTVGDTVTTLESDTRVVLTLSNGNTVSLTAGEGFTAGTSAFEIGASFSDTAAMTGITIDSDTLVVNNLTTITKIVVTDETNQNHTYPAAISYNAGNTVKVGYTNGDLETITSGAYSVGEVVFDSVNVDGVNVIAATLTLSDGSTQKVTSGFYQRRHSVPITTVITIYDSEGNSHAVPVLIDKDASSSDQTINSDALALARVVDDDGVKVNFTSLVQNTEEDPVTSETTVTGYTYTLADGTTGNATVDQVSWDNRWRVYMAPTTGNAGPTYKFTLSEDDGSITSGYLNVVMDESTDNPVDGYPTYLYFNEDGTYNSAATQGSALYTVYSNGNGSSPTTSSLTFDGVTQYAGSTTAYGTADGNSYGVLQSIQIDASGIITGSYSNGVLRNEAQIAVAQFVNNSGLNKVGTSLYQQSNNSGDANIKTVDALGLSITPSALEMSNVELASELADMIVTQRGFQANSKIITVGDEMLETIVNMKR